MDKEKFLKTLEKKLNFLSFEERQREIQKYSEAIDKYTSLSNEQEAIKQLGDIDELVKVISLEKNPQNISSLKKSFIKIKENFQSKDKKLITKTLANLFLILLYVLIIKVPFISLRDLGYEYLGFVFNKTILEEIWYYLFELLYLFTAILVAKRILIKKFS